MVGRRVQIHIYMQGSRYALTKTHAHSRARVLTHRQTHVHMHTLMHVNTHTRTHIPHTRTHIHSHTRTPPPRPTTSHATTKDWDGREKRSHRQYILLILYEAATELISPPSGLPRLVNKMKYLSTGARLLMVNTG